MQNVQWLRRIWYRVYTQTHASSSSTDFSQNENLRPNPAIDCFPLFMKERTKLLFFTKRTSCSDALCRRMGSLRRYFAGPPVDLNKTAATSAL